MVRGCRGALGRGKGGSLVEHPPDAYRGEYEREDVNQSESLHGGAG